MVANQSHVTEQDFSQFVKTYNPDLTTILDWIYNNLDVAEVFEVNRAKPDEVFGYDDLEEWAEAHGYVDERDVIDKSDIKKLLRAIKKLDGLFNVADEKFKPEIDKVLDLADEIESWL